jgi:hypothetical protein
VIHLVDPRIIQGLLGLGYGDNAEVPYGQLVVPEEFQRLLKPRNWDVFVPALFGRAIVCEVEGSLYTVDGIHRVGEGEAHGMWASQDVPCVVYRDCTWEQAAGLFKYLNDGRLSLTAADRFRSACFMDEGEARLLDADLLDIGLDGWCRGRSDYDLGSIGTVVALSEKYGRAHALYTLDAIGQIWPWDKTSDRYTEGSPNIRILKGFGEYLRESKRVLGRRRLRRWNPDDGPMLFEWIATNYPGQEGHESFIMKAQFRRVGGGGGASAVGVEEQLHDCYLKARREQRDAEQEAA